MKKLTKQQMEVVKREHPEWFGLKDSTWYIKPSNGTIQFNIKDGEGYGWCLAHGWVDGARWLKNDYDNEFREATSEEVEQVLIAEAKRRYKDVKNIGGDLTIDDDRIAEYGFSEFHYEKRENRLYSAPDGEGGLVVFDSGQWASVLTPEKPSLQDDIQALKDRWPDINFTVIAEGR